MLMFGSLVLIDDCYYKERSCMPCPYLVRTCYTTGSMLIFGSIVTVTNIAGYLIAFCGVVWYNYLRMPRPTQQPDTSCQAVHDSEKGAGQGQLGPPQTTSNVFKERPDLELELAADEYERQPLMVNGQPALNSGNGIENHVELKQSSQALQTSVQKLHESRKVTR
jgi:hypothetical protein